jgi:hypothetical protein
VRGLLVELDRAPAAVGRAVRTAEPSVVIAALRSLAGATVAAGPHLPATDPLWPVVRRAHDTLAHLAHLACC